MEGGALSNVPSWSNSPDSKQLAFVSNSGTGKNWNPSLRKTSRTGTLRFWVISADGRLSTPYPQSLSRKLLVVLVLPLCFHRTTAGQQRHRVLWLHLVRHCPTRLLLLWLFLTDNQMYLLLLLNTASHDVAYPRNASLPEPPYFNFHRSPLMSKSMSPLPPMESARLPAANEFRKQFWPLPFTWSSANFYADVNFLCSVQLDVINFSPNTLLGLSGFTVNVYHEHTIDHFNFGEFINLGESASPRLLLVCWSVFGKWCNWSCLNAFELG